MGGIMKILSVIRPPGAYGDVIYVDAKIIRK